MISDPYFYLIAFPAVLLTGISKGGFGGALGVVGVPLMALAISPMQAAAIMLPVLCAMDFFGMRAYLGKWDVANLKIIVPGAMIGIVLGTATFGAFSENVIRMAVGVITVAFVLDNLLKDSRKDARAGRSRLRGTFWSGVSGFTSFLAHAGGPPIMMYLMPQRLDKVAFVGTVNAFFLLTNAFKVVAYAGLGQLSTGNLATSLLLAPAVPLGVWLGLHLQRKVNQVWFYRIAQVGLLLTGLSLIIQGVGR